MAGELALDLDNRITLNNGIEKKTRKFFKEKFRCYSRYSIRCRIESYFTRCYRR